MSINPSETDLRLQGEAQVLRGLLAEALSVIETITEEASGDDWMALQILRTNISAVLHPAPTERLL